jgi:hypothetical protein
MPKRALGKPGHASAEPQGRIAGEEEDELVRKRPGALGSTPPG